ncbi:hypothetical protein [Kitasatospora sp. NPDC097643]|uniref:WXG100-like domain-containing protein n=1 Tax=Kitasatospora sp. NPDC097643 TaxID=3157230 RepID=UPI003321380B
MAHSSVHVSDGVASFFHLLTGMPWPESDEGLLRDVQDDYVALAEDLPKLRDYVAELVTVCRSQFEGQAAEAFAAEMERFIGSAGGDDYLTIAGKLCTELGEFAGKVANTVEYTKWMIIGQIVQLLFELALAIFWSPFTGGASLLAVEGAKQVAKQIIIALLKKLVQVILLHTFFGVAGGLLLDAIIQAIQFGQHNRHEWDKDLTKQAAIFGAISGVIAGPLHLLGMGLGKLLGAGFGKLFVSTELGNSLKGLAGGLGKGGAKELGNLGGKELGNLGGKELGNLGSKELGNLGGKELGNLGGKELGNLGGKELGNLGAKELGNLGSKELGGAGAKELGSAGAKGAGSEAGRLLGDEAAMRFAGSIDRILRENSTWLSKGFAAGGKSGANAGARFAEQLATSFEKHLGGALGKDAARELGSKFGREFAEKWAKSPESRAALGASLREIADGSHIAGPELRVLAEKFPELAGHVGKLNTMFVLGHMLGEQLKMGANQYLSEGFYNLIVDDSHQFSASGSSFLSGFLMGGARHLLHGLSSPLMTKYADFVRGLQHADIPPGASKYFGPLHPLTLLSVATNLSGHSVPFPVPRLGQHVGGPGEGGGGAHRTGGELGGSSPSLTPPPGSHRTESGSTGSGPEHRAERPSGSSTSNGPGKPVETESRADGGNGAKSGTQSGHGSPTVPEPAPRRATESSGDATNPPHHAAGEEGRHVGGGNTATTGSGGDRQGGDGPGSGPKADPKSELNGDANPRRGGDGDHRPPKTEAGPRRDDDPDPNPPGKDDPAPNPLRQAFLDRQARLRELGLPTADSPNEGPKAGHRLGDGQSEAVRQQEADRLKRLGWPDGHGPGDAEGGEKPPASPSTGYSGPLGEGHSEAVRQPEQARLDRQQKAASRDAVTPAPDGGSGKPPTGYSGPLGEGHSEAVRQQEQARLDRQQKAASRDAVTPAPDGGSGKPPTGYSGPLGEGHSEAVRQQEQARLDRQQKAASRTPATPAPDRGSRKTRIVGFDDLRTTDEADAGAGAVPNAGSGGRKGGGPGPANGGTQARGRSEGSRTQVEPAPTGPDHSGGSEGQTPPDRFPGKGHTLTEDPGTRPAPDQHRPAAEPDAEAFPGPGHVLGGPKATREGRVTESGTRERRADAAEQRRDEQAQDPAARERAEQRAQETAEQAAREAERQKRLAAEADARARARWEALQERDRAAAEEAARAAQQEARRKAEQQAARQAREAAAEADWQLLLADLRDRSGGGSGVLGEVTLTRARDLLAQHREAGPSPAGPTVAWHRLARELGVNVDSLTARDLMPDLPQALERPEPPHPPQTREQARPDPVARRNYFGDEDGTPSPEGGQQGATQSGAVLTHKVHGTGGAVDRAALEHTARELADDPEAPVSARDRLAAGALLKLYDDLYHRDAAPETITRDLGQVRVLRRLEQLARDHYRMDAPYLSGGWLAGMAHELLALSDRVRPQPAHLRKLVDAAGDVDPALTGDALHAALRGKLAPPPEEVPEPATPAVRPPAAEAPAVQSPTPEAPAVQSPTPEAPAVQPPAARSKRYQTRPVTTPGGAGAGIALRGKKPFPKAPKIAEDVRDVYHWARPPKPVAGGPQPVERTGTGTGDQQERTGADYSLTEVTGQQPFLVLLPEDVHDLDPDHLAAALAEDLPTEALTPETPLVLVGPHTLGSDLTVPRALARATGRTVWTSSVGTSLSDGVVRVKAKLRPELKAKQEKVERGFWIKEVPPDPDLPEPDRPEPAGLGTIPTMTIRKDEAGRRVDAKRPDVVDEAELDSQPVLFPLSRQSGGRLYRDESLTRIWEEVRDGFDPTTPHFEYLPADFLEHDDPTAASKDDDPDLTPIGLVPWDVSAPIYTVMTHATHLAATLPTLAEQANGKKRVHLTGDTLGRIVRRRPSFRRMPKDTQIVLIACQAGARGDNGKVIAQEVADATGNVVWASTTTINLSIGQRVAPIGILSNEHGTPGRWVKFVPGGTPDTEQGSHKPARSSAANRATGSASSSTGSSRRHLLGDQGDGTDPQSQGTPPPAARVLLLRGELHRIVEVPADGNCLLNAILDSGRAALPDWQHAGLDADGLRQLAAAWFRGEDGADFRREIDRRGESPVDRLDPIDPLDDEPEETWQVHLQPGDTEPTILRRADIEQRTMSEMYELAMRNVSLWNTPFFDEAPTVIGRALGLGITVIQGDRRTAAGATGPGVPELLVLRDVGRAGDLPHYSGLASLESHGTTSTVTETPVDREYLNELSGLGKGKQQKKQPKKPKGGSGQPAEQDQPAPEAPAQQPAAQPAVRPTTAEEAEIAAGQRVFRVTDAMTVRTYLLAADFGKIKNAANWAELGPGLYTGHTFGHAASYDEGLRGLPVVMELELTRAAKGLQVVKHIKEDWKASQIDKTMKDYDFLTDGTQFKFHSRFYGGFLQGTGGHHEPTGEESGLKIVSLKVKEGKDSGTWKEYTADEFVAEYENYLIRTHQEKARARLRIRDIRRRMMPPPPEHEETELLQEAPPAHPRDLGRIRYLQQAQEYERRLAAHLGEREDVQHEVGKLARLAWDLTPSDQKHKLGTRLSSVTGMVGTERHLLERVVREGTLRERMALLYNGYRSDHFAKLAGQEKLPRPEALNAERADRQAGPTEESKTGLNPYDVKPPLSDGEWYSAVDKDGILGWQPGAKTFHYRLDSKLQLDAMRGGGLISSGTSGTAFGLLQSAAELSRVAAARGLADSVIDLRLLRLALLAWMIDADDHTFHEIMLGSQLFEESLAYDDTRWRYRTLAPLTEDELRREVAPDGFFPDEHLEPWQGTPAGGSAGQPRQTAVPWRSLSEFRPELRGRLIEDPAMSEQERAAQREALEQFPVQPERYLVVVHTGTDGRPQWNGQPIGPEDLAVLLAEDGAWNGTDELVFVACGLGTALDSTYAPEVLRYLRERELGTTALAPDRNVWFVPSAGGAGHLVVAAGVGVDAQGRPVVLPGGHWTRYRAPEGSEGPPPVGETGGAYLPPVGQELAGPLPEELRSGGADELTGELTGAVRFGASAGTTAGIVVEEAPVPVLSAAPTAAQIEAVLAGPRRSPSPAPHRSGHPARGKGPVNGPARPGRSPGEGAAGRDGAGAAGRERE